MRRNTKHNFTFVPDAHNTLFKVARQVSSDEAHSYFASASAQHSHIRQIGQFLQRQAYFWPTSRQLIRIVNRNNSGNSRFTQLYTRSEPDEMLSLIMSAATAAAMFLPCNSSQSAIITWNVQTGCLHSVRKDLSVFRSLLAFDFPKKFAGLSQESRQKIRRF